MKNIVRNLLFALCVPLVIAGGFLLLPFLFIIMIVVILVSGGAFYKISSAKSKYRDMNDDEKNDVVDIKYEVLDEERGRIEKQ